MNQPPPQALPNGSSLFNGTYRLESCLGQGGFGITYRAADLTLQRTVAIKEFFPDGCGRNGARLALHGGITQANYADLLGRFIEEGRVLARLHHPGIVPVHTLFQENETAYLVMEHIVGQTVRGYLADRGGHLAEHEAIEIIRQAGESLIVVHAANLLHRDIKPANMMRRPNGQIVLIDFGAAREYVSDSAFSQTVILTPGYAPLEQYTRDGKRGPYTDVYGLAATLYHLLTGQRPIEALARASGAGLAAPRQLSQQVSAEVSSAVMQGLALRSEERPQDVGSFLQWLVAREPNPTIRVDVSVPRREVYRRHLIVAGGVGALALGGWGAPKLMRHSEAAPPLGGPTSVHNGGGPPPADATRPAAAQLGDTWINSKDHAVMVYIPAGPFLMGDDDRNDNPRHTATLSGYWIYRDLVTVRMYKRYCQEKGKQMPPEPEFPAGNKFNPGWSKEDNPIVDVSWNDIMGDDGYCVWAGVTLPTEAQWEKAARGTDGRRYPWGDDFDANKAWCSKKAFGDAGGTTAVGRYGISPYGCTDMAGNVWQWCLDGYDENFWSGRAAETVDPVNRSGGSQARVLRGGSWLSFDASNFRASFRFRSLPGFWSAYLGFRCAAGQ